MLYWVPLMANGGEESVIARWQEITTETVSDQQIRGNLAGIVLLFAELVGRRLAWKSGLEGFNMTESQVVNEWMSQGALRHQRLTVLETLEVRLPGTSSADLVRLINREESADLLPEWFLAALKTSTFEQFMAALKQ